jgi:hypothetical protein
MHIIQSPFFNSFNFLSAGLKLLTVGAPCQTQGELIFSMNFRNLRIVVQKEETLLMNDVDLNSEAALANTTNTSPIVSFGL